MPEQVECLTLFFFFFVSASDRASRPPLSSVVDFGISGRLQLINLLCNLRVSAIVHDGQVVTAASVRCRILLTCSG